VAVLVSVELRVVVPDSVWDVVWDVICVDDGEAVADEV
jgi:hypothetical protein